MYGIVSQSDIAYELPKVQFYPIAANERKD